MSKRSLMKNLQAWSRPEFVSLLFSPVTFFVYEFLWVCLWVCFYFISKLLAKQIDGLFYYFSKKMALFDYLEIFPLSDVFRRYGNILKLILILFRFILTDHLELLRMFNDFIQQKQAPDVFCKKGILRNFTKFTEKHLCW